MHPAAHAPPSAPLTQFLHRRLQSQSQPAVTTPRSINPPRLLRVLQLRSELEDALRDFFFCNLIVFSSDKKCNSWMEKGVDDDVVSLGFVLATRQEALVV